MSLFIYTVLKNQHTPLLCFHAANLIISSDFAKHFGKEMPIFA